MRPQTIFFHALANNKDEESALTSILEANFTSKLYNYEVLKVRFPLQINFSLKCYSQILCGESEKYF